MARFLPNAKLFSALIDGVSVPVNRRGYAAVSQGVVSSNVVEGSGAKKSGVVKAGEEIRATTKEASETKCWAPDPVSGYYRPENGAGEIDVTKLQEMVLNKARQH
ncbi:late embryogenesis abundant protein Lea5-like [Macadamia integrifolia]|uniref:late embryogenesis abundant protein Lea5-like n=1 Tax=Macadamia integrifolia TaxID=60698 RepID=UPI001C501586|nr:late embryogenesis abundant protein Lea5-like [Macadamia integrifolia]